jgi:CheY-like chemotaxis protein
MPDEAVGRVFDAFTQADGPYDKKKQGTGLGLRIVKEFVQLMGGSLAVANQEGEGLTMYFTVDLGVEAPAEARAGSAAQTEQANPAPEAPPAREALRGHRLLVVDDDPLSRTTLSQMLRKSGYEVSVAEGGREALERLRETEHDLVLMDIKMPDMDGVQATRRIHKMYQESQSSPPPIVAMTAHAMRGDREAFLDAGLDDYLAKPVLWEELADLLDNHLNRDPESGPSKGEARP